MMVRSIWRVALYGVFSASVVLLFFIQTIKSETLPQPQAKPEEQISEAPPLPTLTTNTWGIFDPQTGMVLKGSNERATRPIASVTKLFTAEAVLRSPRKDEVFTVQYSDLQTEGRSGKLTYGASVTPYELLFPLLIESSNDAAEAIRRHLADEYTNSVTNITTDLSLTHTTITDPSGLSEGNVSSVEDLSHFFSYLRKTHPHILDITRLDSYVGDEVVYYNSNPAHKLNTFTGGKQGFTHVAQRTFVGTFTMPDTGKEIGVVLLASSNLLADIETLLSYSTDIARASDIMTQ